MATFTLRPARPDNRSAVHTLLRAAASPLEGIDDQFDEGFVVAVPVARPDELVGVAGIETYGRFGLLRSVTVAQDWRGRAVGNALVRDRIEWARTHGLDALYLLTTTAGGYFPKLGFEPVSRQALPRELHRAEELASTCPATAQAMCLWLLAKARL